MAEDTAAADNRYASRKFILTVALLLVSLGLLITGLIDAPQWSEISRWTLGLYVAGNVGTWLADALKKGTAP